MVWQAHCYFSFYIYKSMLENSICMYLCTRDWRVTRALFRQKQLALPVYFKFSLEMNRASTIAGIVPKLIFCMYSSKLWGLSILNIHMGHHFGVFCGSCAVWMLSLSSLKIKIVERVWCLTEFCSKVMANIWTLILKYYNIPGLSTVLGTILIEAS